MTGGGLFFVSFINILHYASMKLYLPLFLALICFPVVQSCQSKKDAINLYELYSETNLLYRDSDNNCSRELKRIEKNMDDGGNKASDTLIFYHARNFNDSIAAIQKSLQEYIDTLFYKKLNKDYNYQNFDTLALHNKIELDQAFLKIQEERFRKAFTQCENDEVFKLATVAKRDYQFIKIQNDCTAFNLLEGPVKAGVLLLSLSSLQLELNHVRAAGLKKLVSKIDNRLNFSKLKPYLNVPSNIIEEGENYRAELTFVAPGESFNNISMKANGKPITLNNSIGEVIIEAKADKFDSKGLAKKTWKGEISFRIYGKDTTFVIEKEYYVKKKCYEK
jgi:hypothetical protein